MTTSKKEKKRARKIVDCKTGDGLNYYSPFIAFFNQRHTNHACWRIKLLYFYQTTVLNGHFRNNEASKRFDE